MTKFDPTKPVQTRTGRKARIVCINVKSTYPITAVVTKSDGEEYATTHTLDGRVSVSVEQMPHDLVNIPERTSRWLNVYENGGYSSKEYAGEARAMVERLGFVEIIYEDGVPVDVKLHKD